MQNRTSSSIGYQHHRRWASSLWFSVLLLMTLANSVQCNCTNATKEFKIALLGPWGSGSVKRIEKNYMEKAAKYIVTELNERCAVPGYRLTYSFHDTQCHPGSGIVEMAKARQSNAKAFIGPACEFNCYSASKLSREWNMTMVSYACQSNLLSDRKTHPYFVRTVTTFLETGRFMGAMLDHFKWDKVCIVVNNILAYPWMELMDEIERNYGGLQPTLWTTELNEHEKFLQELDAHMLESFVFVLCMYTKEVASFLTKAKQRGYFQTGRVYIAVDFHATFNEDFTGLLDITLDANLYLEPFKNFFSKISCQDNNCITEEELGQRKITVAQGLALCQDPKQLYDMCCKVCRLPSAEVLQVLGRCDLLKSALYAGYLVNLNQSRVCSLYVEHGQSYIDAALAADAFKLLAEGVAAVVDKQGDPRDLTANNARTIVNKILSKDFEGITGNLSIIKDGSRFTNLQLLNLVHGSYYVIAKTDFLSPRTESRFYKTLSDNVIWPGGSNKLPECPVSICPHPATPISDKTFWLAVSLGTVLGVILLCGGFFYIRLNEKKHKKDWIIPSTKLYAAPAFTGKVGTITGGKNKTLPNKLWNTLWKLREPIEEEQADVSRESLRTFNMGQIFAKVTVLDQQVVAVKPVQKDTIELTESLIDEMNQMRHLKHTNVNQLIGACVESGNICLVWGYCSKGSLRDVLENNDIKLDWMFKMSFTSDIARGMAYLHTNPVGVHGRLKSTNVVVDNNWCCKITDYSMPNFRAGEQREDSQSKHYFYNLLWTAPELLGDEEQLWKGTKKGDMYSFAIIMQEIVTRAQPYGYQTGDNPEDIIKRLMVRERPPYRPKMYPLPPVAAADAGLRQALLDLMTMCWDHYPLLRMSFNTFCGNMKKIRQADGTTANLVDQMLILVRKYADNLEELVEERTRQLEDEQKKNEELLGRMLPKTVAHDLKMGLPVIPECYISVTLFFSDILGFADIAQVSTPIQVVNLLNDLYICFDNVIETYDAYKVETIADNYVVSSGLPIMNGDQHAAVIATLALDLLTNVLSFKVRHIPDLQILLRIGIHTGPVVAGVVGRKMPRYCLFGDTVNYTSRLESNGKPLHIHVSPECTRCLEKLGGFILKERGLVEMKGKGKILTYFLVGKDGFECRVPHLRMSTLKLIGININDYHPDVSDSASKSAKAIAAAKSGRPDSPSPPPTAEDSTAGKLRKAFSFLIAKSPKT